MARLVDGAEGFFYIPDWHDGLFIRWSVSRDNWIYVRNKVEVGSDTQKKTDFIKMDKYSSNSIGEQQDEG